MIIFPISKEELKIKIEKEPDAEMKQAYSEMLDGCVKNPKQHLWYTVWMMQLKEGDKPFIGDLCFKGLDEKGTVEIGYGIDQKYESRGLTTEALAQQADGKYFTSDTILAENGSLKNLANGVYFFVGAKTEKTEAPSTGGKYPDRRLGYATFTNGMVLFSWVYSRTWRKV